LVGHQSNQFSIYQSTYLPWVDFRNLLFSFFFTGNNKGQVFTCELWILFHKLLNIFIH
jgi:hypothetical protein